MQLPVDVYQCEGCGSAFCVEKDQDVLITPCCESELFEYSYTGKVVNEE